MANKTKYIELIYIDVPKIEPNSTTPLEKSKESTWKYLCGEKTAGSVLLHRKVAGSVSQCCCFFVCENLLSPYCLESVSQFFPRCVFPRRFFPLFGVVVVADVVVVDDGECCCCRSITWMCSVYTCAVDLCIGWLVFILYPHSTPFQSTFQAVLSRFRVQNAILTVPNGGEVWWCVFWWSHRSYRADPKYRTESFFSRSLSFLPLSVCLGHTPQAASAPSENVHITHFPKCKRSPPIVKTTSRVYTLENECENGKYASQTKRNTVA